MYTISSARAYRFQNTGGSRDTQRVLYAARDLRQQFVDRYL
jgi:hypothetical protein